MTTTPTPPPYILGNTDAEHGRLIRQAAALAPTTERLFRDAGIGPGMRVLDIGAGVGEVSLLIARLVGPGGSVTGIDRDAAALTKARSRAVAAGAQNVHFVEGDVADFESNTPFDAVAGRFILQFIPNPAAVIRLLACRVRPGGVMVFQEPSWASASPHAAHLPLRSACIELFCEALRRGGAQPDMGLALFRGFSDCGFPAPHMRIDIPIGHDLPSRRWLYELLCTVRPRFETLGISSDAVGDFDTLEERLDTELSAARSYATFVGLVGAWSRKPISG
jgi:SAM-dependent methyltransferase